MAAQKKTRKDKALAKLRETRILTTGMLAPLGLSLDAFLHYVQLPEAQQQRFVNLLLSE